MLEATTNDSFNSTTSLPAPLSDVPWYFALLIVGLGIVGNILVCAAIMMNKGFQTNTNYFLFSLSVVDLLICVAVIPVRWALYVYELEPSAFPLCVFYLLGDDILTSASALHICFISTERYYAIKDPLGASRMTKGKLLKRILLVWVMSFLTIIPYVISALLTKYPRKATYCIYLLERFPYFDMVLLTEALVIFIMVAVVFYTFIGTVVILCRLVKQQSDPQNPVVRHIAKSQDIEGSSHKLRALNSEKRALKVVWFISFTFIVVLVPYGICNIIYISSNFSIPTVIYKIVAYLSYTNSVINPILYTIFNEQFRRYFVNFILLKFKSHKAS